MATLTIDPDLRHQFDHRWRAYTARKIKEAGDLHTVIIDPVMSTNEHGRLVYINVPSEFLDELQNDHFGIIGD